MVTIELLLLAIPKYLQAAFRSLETALKSSLAIKDEIDARRARHQLEQLTVFLNGVMFEPGGIRHAVKQFCDNPMRATWAAVQDRVNANQVVLRELKRIIERTDKSFAAKNPDLLRALDEFMFMKQGRLYSLLGSTLTKPESPEDIAKLRQLDSVYDAENAKIVKVQERIKRYLEEPKKARPTRPTARKGRS